MFSLPTVPAMIELVVHLHASVEEVLGQVGAVEADGLVGVGAVVVVPVEQRAEGVWLASAERVHARACRGCRPRRREAKRSSLIMDMMVQGTMPRNSSMLVQHWTAVTVSSRGRYPGVDDRAELGHLEQRGLGRDADGDVFLDGGELCLRRVVGVLHAADAAHDFAEVEGFDGDAAALQQFFASSGRC